MWHQYFLIAVSVFAGLGCAWAASVESKRARWLWGRRKLSANIWGLASISFFSSAATLVYSPSIINKDTLEVIFYIALAAISLVFAVAILVAMWMVFEKAILPFFRHQYYEWRFRRWHRRYTAQKPQIREDIKKFLAQ
jgi:Na+/proline symporter